MTRIPVTLYRWGLNFWPCIWFTGGRVTHLSPDFRRLTVRLKLTWRTRNIVGTIYGGSLYSSTDPFYMLMLMQILGKDYVVWDKGCTIRFKRPAKQTVFAEFHITDAMLAELKTQVATRGHTTVVWPIAFRSADGVVFTELEKQIYVSTKQSYAEHQRQKS